MHATVTIELTRIDTGTVVTRRRTKNAVMQGGAHLIATLLSGQGTPITHMAVGTSDAPNPEAFDTAALTVAAEDLAGETEATIPAENFTIAVDEARHVVKLRVRASLPDGAAVGQVREAGLVARTSDTEAILYNRITFAPITKGDDHELTLFWDITFPYGDLQWF